MSVTYSGGSKKYRASGGGKPKKKSSTASSSISSSASSKKTGKPSKKDAAKTKSLKPLSENETLNLMDDSSKDKDSATIKKQFKKAIKKMPKRPSMVANVKTAVKALENIRKAAEDLHVVEILYTNKNAEKSRRTLEPYSLKKLNGSWKLYGFCLLRQEIRAFEIKNIMECYVLNRSYTPRFDVTVEGDFKLMQNQFTR